MRGMKKIEVLKFVIARRERSEGRGNPSCLGVYFLRVWYVTVLQWIATGLRPRDDKGGVFTMRGMKKIEVLKFVIARRERSEGRGNPSCLGGRGRVCLFAY